VGSRKQPVTDVTVRGLGFRDSRYTYMEPWGVPSGGDCIVAGTLTRGFPHRVWMTSFRVSAAAGSLHRGAALFIERTEGVTVESCIFQRLDGNGLQLSGYNRRSSVMRNEFAWIGDTAMSAWGYTDEEDGTGGDQPRGTRVQANICREVGIFELQSACWFQAKTAQTHIESNLFFNVSSQRVFLNTGLSCRLYKTTVRVSTAAGAP
jgi:hypothetical protein